MGVVTTSGFYGILNNPTQEFQEWRYLVVGTEYADGFVYPQAIDTEPTYDPDLEYLTEGTPRVDLIAGFVYKTWIINTINLDVSGNPKKFLAEILDLPLNPNAAEIERNRIGNLLRTAAKSNLDNMELWIRLHAGAELAREEQFYKLRTVANDQGFYYALINLANAANLTVEEKTTLNGRLKKYNLRRVL